MNTTFVPLKSTAAIHALGIALRHAGRLPSEEEVHSLRRLIRRVEAVRHFLEPESVEDGLSLHRNLARIRKQAGAVRDMDVLITLASALPIDREEDGVCKLLKDLSAERHRRARKLHRTIVRHGVSTQRSLQELSRLIEQGTGTAEKRIPGGQPANTTQIEMVSNFSAELAAWPRLSADNLHAFRRRAREVRSVLQLLGEDSSERFSLLDEVKDAIGEWHDWTILASTALDLGYANRSLLMKEIRSTVRAKYSSARLKADAMRNRILD